MIKPDGHLITREECRKHERLASVFYISLVLYHCSTRLRRLHLPNDIEVIWQKNNETRFFYVCTTWLFDQLERAQGPIYIIKVNKKCIVLHVNKTHTVNKNVFFKEKYYF